MKLNIVKNTQRLEERAHFLQAFLDYSPDVIIAGDVKGLITEFNKGAEKLLGYTKEEMLGCPIKILYCDSAERDKMMELVKKYGAVVDYEIKVRTKTGKIIPISTTTAFLRDKRGNIIGTIGVGKDIRRRKSLEQKLIKMSITDGVTRLYDRGYFDKRIDVAVNDANRFKRPLALIMMDLDGFKKCNDTKGHLAGDKLLQRVGRILLRTIRHKVDSCYRFGGDEFVIIVPEKFHAVARNIAEELRVEVELALAPEITASIGVAKLKTGQSVYDFIKSADEAMYQAKTAGGNRICVRE